MGKSSTGDGLTRKDKLPKESNRGPQEKYLRSSLLSYSGALATGVGSVTALLAGDAVGGGGGGGQGPAVVEPAYAQPGGGAAAGEPAPQQFTNPIP